MVKNESSTKTENAPETKKKISKNKELNYSSFINKLLKSSKGTSYGIQELCLGYINDVIILLRSEIINICIPSMNKKKKITRKIVDISVQSLFGSDFQKFEKKFRTFEKKCFKNYEESKEKKAEGTKRTTTSEKCGLIFPIARTYDYMRSFRKIKGTPGQVSAESAVFLTCFLEFFTKTILDECILTLKDKKRIRITPIIFNTCILYGNYSETFEKLNFILLGIGKEREPLVETSRKQQKGENSKRQIIKYQNTDQKIFLAKSPFGKQVKKFSDGMNVQSHAKLALQLFIENEICDLFEKSYEITKACKRERLQKSDIETVLKITN